MFIMNYDDLRNVSSIELTKTTSAFTLLQNESSHDRSSKQFQACKHVTKQKIFNSEEVSDLFASQLKLKAQGLQFQIISACCVGLINMMNAKLE